MTEITIIHRIEAPDLSAALNNLADALKARPVAAPAVQNAPQPVPATNITPAPETPVQAPVAAPTPAPQPTPIPAAAPTVAAPPPAPAPVEAPTPAPAPAKVYTFEDITNAGSQLLEMDRVNQSSEKMTQLMELLKGYGVQAVTQLKPEQYADVAAGLRGLGATI